MMGAIAAQMAVVADDNPRSENPAAIRRDPAGGARRDRDRRPPRGDRCVDRGLAPGDVLLIAGKGHETGQIIGKQVLPFSDHEAVAAALPGGWHDRSAALVR